MMSRARRVPFRRDGMSDAPRRSARGYRQYAVAIYVSDTPIFLRAESLS